MADAASWIQVLGSVGCSTVILDPSLAKSPEPRHVNDLESLYDLNLSNVDSAEVWGKIFVW